MYTQRTIFILTNTGLRPTSPSSLRPLLLWHPLRLDIIHLWSATIHKEPLTGPVCDLLIVLAIRDGIRRLRIF